MISSLLEIWKSFAANEAVVAIAIASLLIAVVLGICAELIRLYFSDKKPSRKHALLEGAFLSLMCVLVTLSALFVGFSSNIAFHYTSPTIDAALIAEGINQEALPSLNSPDDVPVGWGDNGGGRLSITNNDINKGVLGDTIIFNAISDSPIGDEKNFVGARLVTGNEDGASNLWNADLIEAEDGCSYYVRLYVHNNSPLGYGAVAENVRIRFQIRNYNVAEGGMASVHGYISAPTATPEFYWDGIKFVADRPFHLVYEPGSAFLNSNMFEQEGLALDDSIVSGGTFIGYGMLDGRIPGCYEYACIAVIRVHPVFD